MGRLMEEVHVKSDFTLIGQLAYEVSANEALSGAGIRLYQGVDPNNKACQFLCVQDADTLEEAWFRIEGVKMVPVSLRGLEKLPHDPR
jgi:hypothetical protein